MIILEAVKLKVVANDSTCLYQYAELERVLQLSVLFIQHPGGHL